MRLYYHPVSTTSRSVMQFAAESNIYLEYQLVDLLAGEQQRPAFTAINPNQLVPVLEDGDFRLSESSAILKYLADQVGSPAYPTDAKQRARVNERMDWFNTGLSRELNYGLIYPQIFPSHRRPDEHAQAHTLAWGGQRAIRLLNVLDKDLIGTNAYVCGDQVTLADYLGIAMITLGEAIAIDYSRWASISRWIARMKDREAWSKVNEAFYAYIVQPNVNLVFQRL